ncbi:hypothetical protein [Ichthyenterobacterium magnum]|uniref:hypothetical protein n=1 Tax=Ichthyenterobacterium magnum TaxID=1230530 RepID=UPI0013C2D50E|nr:hypothetical protein [Ichthyenterobacterium magnum]
MLYPYLNHTTWIYDGGGDALLKCWKPERVFNILMTFLVLSEWMTKNGIFFFIASYKVT